ncbi:MAG: hypothetical protein KGI06_05045 [Candidatus Micrarchaeota archaeon]|nr:hypothetical protein [Candidatus Micrarchaeota archaeon]
MPKKSVQEKLMCLARGIYAKEKRAIAGIVLSSIVATPALARKRHERTLYNLMIGETFRHDSASIERIVHAVPQLMDHGGPAYLINGLTDSGWWYQFGIEYKWPSTNERKKFYFTYEIWDSKDSKCNNSVADVSIIYPMKFPDSKNAGTNPMLYRETNSLRIKSGDWVKLGMRIQNGMIIMSGKDTRNGTTMEIGFKANGSKFVGTRGDDSEIAGCFSGLLTELYTYSNIPPKEKEVEYISTYGEKNRSPIVWCTFDRLVKDRFDNEYDKEKSIKSLSTGATYINMGIANMEISSDVFVTGNKK